MADQNTLNRPRKRHATLPNRWSVGAGVIAFLVIMPIVCVVWIALRPTENIWPHLLATTLPRYAANSAILAVGVGGLAGAMGTGAAWLLTMYSFPGSRWLNWAMFLPLAVPAYVGAYALVDFFEYAGPVQIWLRGAMGWHTSRDYWFPEIRSDWAAIVVLSAALYPYVYLIVRSGLRESSGGVFEVARSLGKGPVARFIHVGLPLMRPAIAASVAIVMMETVSDYGVVSYFAVQTLTTGIFTTWFEASNAGGAAQIAVLILVVALVLVALEKQSRRRLRFFQSSRQSRPIAPARLKGARGAVATLLCLFPVALGFVLPVSVMGWHAMANTAEWFKPGLFAALSNSLLTGGVAAAVTVLAALFMTYGARMSGRAMVARLLPFTVIGYAAPGAVLGVGLLFPISSLDHAVADLFLAISGHDTGLLMTGSAFAIIYAYAVRFFAVAQGAVDAALGRIPPSLTMAARSLGKTPGQALREVTVPIIRGSVGTALLLVFVDCVKELPATLLLRPFNFNTLATRTYEKASLEQIGQASPAALLVIGVGLCAVVLLVRTSRARSNGNGALARRGRNA